MGTTHPVVVNEPGRQRCRKLQFLPRRHMAHILSLTGYNLTNALYRHHTSFIKDLAPEIGRGVKVGYSMRFF